MTHRIYQYRDFTITLDVESAAILSIGMTPRPSADYLCRIRIRHVSRNHELLPIHLIGEKGRPFQSTADAIFAGIRAAENAIDQVHANAHV